MNTVEAKKNYELHVIGIDKVSQTAESGKFRAVVWMYSEPYQIGDDFPNKEEARVAISIATLSVQSHYGTQIYNDKGEHQLSAEGEWL